MSRTTPDAGPAEAVAQPVIRALDAVIGIATASFLLSVVGAVAAVLAPAGPVHDVAHWSLILLMALVAVVRLVHVARHRKPTDPQVWTRAAEVDLADVRLARILSVAVPAMWLVGTATVIALHLSALHHAMLLVGAWLPLLLLLWALATFAWLDFCSERVAAGLDESRRRYRQYWHDIGQGGAR